MYDHKYFHSKLIYSFCTTYIVIASQLPILFLMLLTLPLDMELSGCSADVVSMISCMLNLKCNAGVE